jgi:hypothetical protein
MMVCKNLHVKIAQLRAGANVLATGDLLNETACRAAHARTDNAPSGSTFEIREIDEQFPAYLRRNPGRFSHMPTSAETSVFR